MLSSMLPDAIMFISCFDPSLDLCFMPLVVLLFFCVGRWSALHPMLDAGASSVLLFLQAYMCSDAQMLHLFMIHA